MTGRRIGAVVAGAIAMGVGLLVLIMGSLPTDYRDADGYYMDEPVTYDRSSRAIVTNDVDILRGVYTQLADDSFILFAAADPLDFRMRGVASGNSPLFMGIAPTSAVDAYLTGVAHHEVTEVDRHEESKEILDVRYTAHEGTTAPSPPGAESFWESSVEGTGRLTLDWTLQPGDWTGVIMNADASSGVSADLAFGAAPPANLDSI